eukprot:g33275.t1
MQHGVPTSSTPGLTPGGRITASAYTEDYRREIALGIGDYFIRCLRGVNRGPSGRHKISLPSKESESQVSKLVDTRWGDLFLHHLNEIDQLTEKKRKLAFKKLPDPPTDHNLPSPKRKGKGPSKGSGSVSPGKDGLLDKEASQ